MPLPPSTPEELDRLLGEMRHAIRRLREEISRYESVERFYCLHTYKLPSYPIPANSSQELKKLQNEAYFMAGRDPRAKQATNFINHFMPRATAFGTAWLVETQNADRE
jgi:hypothetical protein